MGDKSPKIPKYEEKRPSSFLENLFLVKTIYVGVTQW
jgi:hypothetical protein